MNSTQDNFDMEVHKKRLKLWEKEAERDKAFQKANKADLDEKRRSDHQRRAANAIGVTQFIKGVRPPGRLTRMKHWFLQVIPRTHWGIYSADGKRRLTIWKTWLGKVTKIIDVRIG